MSWLTSPAYNLDLTRTYQAPLTPASVQDRQRLNREVVDGNGMLLPHYRSFVGLFNTMTKLYSYRWDEAMRYGEENAKAMQRDAYLRSLQQERILPLARWKWEIKVDSDEDDLADSESGILGAGSPQMGSVNPSNPKDPYSNDREDVRRKLESICRRTHELHQMRIYLGQAIWYGRYGSQLRWDKINIAGEHRWAVGYAEPVQGDKIFHDWDGTPGVMINAGFVSQYPPDLVRTTDRGGPVLLLKRPEFRRRFIIHKHLVEDADYFDYMQGGRVHGVGLRDFCYWAWWLRDEMLSWLVDFMEKVGNLGLWLFPYEEGNPDSRSEAETAAKNVQGRSALAVPVPKGMRDRDLFKPELVSANVAGANFLQEVVGDYFERHIERLFVGQSMSSGSDGEGSLGGTGRAEFAADTKFNLLSFDAENLAATLTNDLLTPIQRMNFPESKWRYTWNFSLPDPKAKDKLDAGTKLVSAGVSVKADELREAGGYTKPDEGDEIVGGAQPGMPGMGGIGPDGQPLPVPGGGPMATGADNPQGMEPEVESEEPEVEVEEPANPVPSELVAAMLKAASEDDMETVDRLAELAKDPEGLAGLMDDLDGTGEDFTRNYASLWWESQPRDADGRWLKLGKKRKSKKPTGGAKEESRGESDSAGPTPKTRYSWVGVELSGVARKKLLSLAYAIPSDDLAGDGRETDPHVTVRYGLHTNNPDDVADVVGEFGKFAINFGELGVFELDEYDVVYVKVASPRLRKLNRELGDLEHTDTHGEYKPHATIAYVKKGLGKEIVRVLAEDEKEPITAFTVENVIFSTPDDEGYEIPLSKADPAPDRVYSYEWTAAQTKSGKTKAVWSLGGRKPLYGEQARRALERQNKTPESESADNPQQKAADPQKKLRGAAVQAKALGQSRESEREKSRQAYQKAIADPSSLTTADIDGLRDALHTLKRDEIREAVKSLGEKTFGKLKMELVDRLLDHVRGKMPTQAEKPLSDARRGSVGVEQKQPDDEEDEELSRDEIAEFDKRIQEAKLGKRAELEAKSGPLPIQASEEELTNDDYEPDQPKGRTAKIGGVEFSEDELSALRQRREKLAASRTNTQSSATPEPTVPKETSPSADTPQQQPKPKDTEKFKNTGTDKKRRAGGIKKGTIAWVVAQSGGINPESFSFLQSYSGVKEAIENGIPLGIFRKDGMGLDQVAEEMESDGHFQTPDSRNKTDYLLELIASQADSAQYAAERDYDAAYEAYARELEEAKKYATESEIAEAIRVGQELGASETESGFVDDAGELDENNPASDGSTPQDDFEFGANAEAKPDSVKNEDDEPIGSMMYRPESQLDIFGNKIRIPKSSPKGEQMTLITPEMEQKEKVRQTEEFLNKLADMNKEDDAESADYPHSGSVEDMIRGFKIPDSVRVSNADRTKLSDSKIPLGDRLHILANADTHLLDKHVNAGQISGNEYLRSLANAVSEREKQVKSDSPVQLKMANASIDSIISKTKNLVGELRNAGESEKADFYEKSVIPLMESIRSSELYQKQNSDASTASRSQSNGPDGGQDIAMIPKERFIDNHPDTGKGDWHRTSVIMQHRKAVVNALKSGKTVPPEVLADYPDLANKYATKQKDDEKTDKGAGSPQSESRTATPDASIMDQLADETSSAKSKGVEFIANAINSGMSQDDLMSAVEGMSDSEKSELMKTIESLASEVKAAKPIGNKPKNGSPQTQTIGEDSKRRVGSAASYIKTLMRGVHNSSEAESAIESVIQVMSDAEVRSLALEMGQETLAKSGRKKIAAELKDWIGGVISKNANLWQIGAGKNGPIQFDPVPQFGSEMPTPRLDTIGDGSKQPKTNQTPPKLPSQQEEHGSQSQDDSLGSLDDMGRSELVDLAKSIGIADAVKGKGSADIRAAIANAVRKKSNKS